eukprot:COSAG05_NODE_8_length_40675_cov_148.837539_27_plen_167_part_00
MKRGGRGEGGAARGVGSGTGENTADRAARECGNVVVGAICADALLTAVPPTDTESDTAIPLPNVESPILSKVIEYCTWHVKAEQDRTSKEVRDEWDQKFVDVDQGTLFHLILAANYLNIKSLLDLTCKTVADMIKGKTPEEIRAHFNIQVLSVPAHRIQICPAGLH